MNKPGSSQEKAPLPLLEADRRSPRSQLNLTLSEGEVWEFREWCVRHRMKQQDAFRKAFEMLKAGGVPSCLGD